MGDIRICCPHCQQVLTCDQAWCGQEMQCPSCQGTLLVPAAETFAQPAHNPLVPRPPKGGASRLSLGGHSQQPAQPGRSIPIRDLAGPPPKKSNPLVKIAVGVVVTAALGVGGYYGFQYVSERQQQLNAKRAAAEKNSDGGEVGHTMELYNVLDATEPGREGPPPDARSRRRDRPAEGVEIPGAAEGAAAAPAPEAALPIVPATYTLDVARAKIPESRVNGVISGTNFLAETARIDPAGSAHALRLIEGPLTSPNRGVLIYLRLKPGEKLGGQKVTVSPDMKTGVPTITKLWRTDPRYAARQQNYFNGYALKLELGEATNDVVSGKIFLAFPDKEQSVLAGAFEASTAMIEAGVQPTATQVTPGAGGPMSPERAAFERRYGVRR